MTSPGSAPSRPAHPEQTLAAARAILRPLAELLLAHGVQHAQIAELLKTVLVDAARASLAIEQPTRAVSKISLATGIHRKEVKRLLEAQSTPEERGRYIVSEVFARWLSDPVYLGPDRRPRALPRAASEGAASFESLTRAVTRDVHPRAVLDEMKRLKLVRETAEAVILERESFVSGDPDQALAILSANVHDHLAAAVANVLTPAPAFLEQALVVDELSEQSVAELKQSYAEHWRRLAQAVLADMTRLWEHDQTHPPAHPQRVRLGLYEYVEPMSPAPIDPAIRQRK